MKPELLHLAKEIIAKNQTYAISGSLALTLHGIKTRREPTDIDVYQPFGEPKFVLPNGVSSVMDEDDAMYDNEEFERFSFRHTPSGIKIDLFRPIKEDIYPFYITKQKGVRCLLPEDIIRFKIQHALGSHYTRFKHKDDIIFMMSTID